MEENRNLEAENNEQNTEVEVVKKEGFGGKIKKNWKKGVAVMVGAGLLVGGYFLGKLTGKDDVIDVDAVETAAEEAPF